MIFIKRRSSLRSPKRAWQRPSTKKDMKPRPRRRGHFGREKLKDLIKTLSWKSRKTLLSHINPFTTEVENECWLRGWKFLFQSCTTPFDWAFDKLSQVVMYECTCKTIESLKLINITTFDQNQFMTCYLIFNFRPTYFSYFQKIIANSNSHSLNKLVEPKVPSP